MQEFVIRLRSVQDVLSFVALATRRSFPIQVINNGHQVNAKSFMEMFCLNLKQPLRVRFQCSEEDFQQFCQDAQRFLVQ